jgi:hypothetical protein
MVDIPDRCLIGLLVERLGDGQVILERSQRDRLGMLDYHQEADEQHDRVILRTKYLSTDAPIVNNPGDPGDETDPRFVELD